jgi:hypothetical protein
MFSDALRRSMQRRGPITEQQIELDHEEQNYFFFASDLGLSYFFHEVNVDQFTKLCVFAKKS